MLESGVGWWEVEERKTKKKINKVLKRKRLKSQRRETENNQMSRKHDPWGRIKRTCITCLKDKTDKGM